MANHTLSPSTLHTACPSSFSLLSFFILFFSSFVLVQKWRKKEEDRERERDERAKLLDHLGRHVARASAAFSRNLPIEGPTDPPHADLSFTFYDFSK